MSQFENPYNFVPAPPRKTDDVALGDGLGDLGHHAWLPGRISGRLRVRLTTVTPLLVPDKGSEDHNGHKRFGLRVDELGVPVLPPTAIRGALRSAYEAITNSRFGVFEAHDQPLGFRNPARGNVDIVPARVSDDGQHFELFEGFGDGSQRAAWVPAYGEVRKDFLTRGVALAIRSHHGQPYWAVLEKFQKFVFSDRDNVWKKALSFWRVRALTEDEASARQLADGLRRSEPSGLPEASLRGRRTTRAVVEPFKVVRGYLCFNGRNMNNKHDERLFFNPPSKAPPRAPISDAHRKAWKTLIEDYVRANQRELDKGFSKPSALGEGCGFSRHILQQYRDKNAAVLEPGALVYLLRQGGQIQQVYPVLISRELFKYAPAELAPESLRPARTLGELSPADRVFGWVAQKEGQGAWKGLLRIGPVHCAQGAAAIQRFDGQGLPLAILGQPKPAQSRFYVAANPRGDALAPKLDKARTYASGQGLRGRKVYLHQRQGQLDGYWQAQPADSLRLNGKPVYPEWKRAGGTRDDQNRSITAWIKPGARFEFDIDVHNLSEVELGALLWLLTLPEGHHLKVGGGKPLGFGSVRAELVEAKLADGQTVAQAYRAFEVPLAASAPVLGERCVAAYREALQRGQGQAFERLPTIRAFLNAACGGALPVHYPRSQQAPHPDGKQFEWFVTNEKVDKGALLNGNPLPALWQDDRGLSIPTSAGHGGGGKPSGHGGGGKPGGQGWGGKHGGHGGAGKPGGHGGGKASGPGGEGKSGGHSKPRR